jgi:hypothetical protein
LDQKKGKAIDNRSNMYLVEMHKNQYLINGNYSFI